jgi:alpha-tubulin suppressor-like RCC1 family protein
VRVSGLSGVQAVDGGWRLSLALKNDGTLWAWGYNNVGQLGDGTTTNSNTPVQVSNLSGVQAISVGVAHSLALKNDGTLWAWGSNQNGQLGNGTVDINAHPIPVQISGLSGVQAVAGGGRHSLVVASSDGTVDKTAPKVKSTFPKANAEEVAPTANVRATFSEEMRPASVMNAFKLFRKGSTNQIDAQVSYDAATDIATLNPDNNLRRGATYKAVVTTVAKDLAGNRLDQNPSLDGLQKKVWFFEID